MKHISYKPLIILCLLAVSYGCASTQIPQTNTTVRIDSQPPGALVNYCPSASYREDAAIVMGKTPLVRYQALPDAGASVQLSLRGYKQWLGTLSPSSPTVTAKIEPLSEAEKKAAGWVSSTSIDRINVVPVRIGTQKIGDTFQPDAPEFRNSFITTFQGVMQRRFGHKSSSAPVAALEENGAVMEALEGAVKGVDMSQLAARPTPVVIDFPAEARTAMTSGGGAVLFVRAEAYYLGGGARFARAAIPILLSVASAAGGAAAAHASGASYYTYYTYGPGPTQDLVLAQGFLVHAQTRELLWFGQATAFAHYEDAGVTSRVAEKLAEQVPSAVLKRN